MSLEKNLRLLFRISVCLVGLIFLGFSGDSLIWFVRLLVSFIVIHVYIDLGLGMVFLCDWVFRFCSVVFSLDLLFALARLISMLPCFCVSLSFFSNL